MSYIIVKRRALKEDGWTYGDWRQYVAFLDNGQAVCCRTAWLPYILSCAGCILLLLVAECLAVMGSGADPIWPRLYALAFLGFLLNGPAVLFTLTSWRCMATVGPLMDKEPDGDYYKRRFHGE